VEGDVFFEGPFAEGRGVIAGGETDSKSLFPLSMEKNSRLPPVDGGKMGDEKKSV